MQKFEINGVVQELSEEEFIIFCKNNNLEVDSNGNIFEITMGVIPQILNTWFNARLEYKKKMKEAKTQEETEYYDRRQHIQKIFLNSCYGYIALPVSRFYNRDNGEAVTLSGQEVIKTSEKLIAKSKKVQYVDTDSLYILAENKNVEEATKEAKTTEKELNEFYGVMCKKLFNIDTHRIQIKGEAVADAGIWITKKRYALHKIFDLDKNKKTDEITVKGLDIVRSSFPNAFKRFMKDCLKDILAGVPQSDIDTRLETLYNKLTSLPIEDISRNTGISDMNKYFTKTWTMGEYKKGTPAHIKAAINYNRLVKHFKLNNKYAYIASGDKIKWAILKNNPYEIGEIAFKGKNDPPKLLEFINSYIDSKGIFDAELLNKLESFYSALNWKLPSLTTKQTDVENFFSF